MKAIILARVSSEEQITDGLSIPAQLQKARSYALTKGLTIQSEHQFDESSLKDHRAKFERVIEEIQTSKEKIALIVETVDRLQRSFKESVLLDDFRRRGTLEIHFIRENLVIHKDSNSSEIQRWDLGVFLAKSYVLQISDNVKRSIAEKMRKGELSGHAPFGYINVKDEAGKANIEPHPLKSKIVQEMYKWYSTGSYSMELIRKKVFDLWNIQLHKSKVDNILKNPFYYGEMRFSGMIAPHKYQTLISKELFDRVQSVKESYNKKPSRKQGKIPILYRGILFCHHCGCTITAEKKRKKSGREYTYYQCTEYHGKHGALRLREEEITRQFSEYFKQIQIPDNIVEAIRKDLKNSHQGKKEYFSTMRNSLELEYAKLEKRIEQMYDDKLDGCITEDEYNKRLQRYRIEQNAIQEKLKNLHTADEDYYTTANYLLNLSNRIPQLFESSKPEIKRRLLNLLLSNPTLNGVNVTATIRKPFSRWAKGQSCLLWGARQDTSRVTQLHTVQLLVNFHHRRKTRLEVSIDLPFPAERRPPPPVNVIQQAIVVRSFM
ncbi:MAG: recombinase family protein, partial [Alphaproteobacteria bacterium]|nr:recombinase family protein [Alphaproteobacteria bacterium]